MKKRLFAMLLVLTMVMALLPAAAAQPVAAENELTQRSLGAQIDAQVNVNKRSLPGISVTTVSQDDCFVQPYALTGDYSTVAGNTMPLRVYLYNSTTQNGTLGFGFQIYKGTSNTITDNDYVYEENYLFQDTGGGWLDFEWDTTGCAAGDYVAIFYTFDYSNQSNPVYIFSVYTEVYVSKTAIPLESLKITFENSNVLAVGDTEFAYLTRVPEHATDTGYDYTLDLSDTGVTSGQEYLGFVELTGVKPGTTVLTATHGGKTVNQDVYVYQKFDTFAAPSAAVDIALCAGAEKTVSWNVSPAALGNLNFEIRGGDCVQIGAVSGSTVTLKAVKEGTAALYACNTNVNGAVKQEATMTINVVGHNYVETSRTESTCTEHGSVTKTCTYCGDAVTEELPLGDHTFSGELTVITAPKATKPGEAVGFCEICQQEVTVELPAIFTDTDPNRYYSDALDYCYENKLVAGMTESTFGPNTSLTRGQLMTLLYRLAGSPEVTGENPFADVGEARFYYSAVVWAYENGIAKGVTETEFQPGDPVTRQQLATFLYRFAEYNNVDTTGRADLTVFTDEPEVGKYAKEAVSWAVSAGLIKGITDTTLCPGDDASRAQFVTILYRFIEANPTVFTPSAE